jgi:protease-4
MKRVIQFVVNAVAVLVFVGILIGIGSMMSVFNPPEEKVAKSSILVLELDGVIMDGKEFLENLRKYRKDKQVKGVLIRIASPGGVVGPSQEMHDEIKRTREEFNKPVIAYCSSVAASGAYYAAVAADKIYTTPGCMVGSIGALMEFVNLEKLYDWAKIQRYAITTGKFKDAGAEYKPLTGEQRELFQEMLNDVLSQFKAAIVEGRKMKPEFLDKYADGRIFTGAQAVKLGFADTVGTFDDARKALGQLTGLGDDPEMFKPRRPRSLRELFMEEANTETRFSKVAEEVLQLKLSAQPLFLFPGALRF